MTSITDARFGDIKDGELSQLFQTSKLDFSIPDSTVVVNQRRTVEIKTSTPVYNPSDVIRIDFGSDQDFVYGPNSYLMYDVAAVGQTISLGADSKNPNLTACLQDIKTTAKSMQLEYIRGLNTLTHIKDHYSCNQGYLGHTGTLMGYSGGNILAGGANARRCVVPLHHISTFWSQDKYIPLSELGTVTMELTLATANKSFLFAAGAGSYTVSNVRLVLDSYTMADAVLRKTRQLAQAGRLVLAYDTFDYNNASVGAATSNSVEFKRSVAKALSVYARVKDSDNDSKTDADSNQSHPWADGTSNYQWRIGSEFHPLVPVSTSQQAFIETLKAWGNASNCVRPPTVTTASFAAHHGLISAELERDINMNNMMSGISSRDANRIILEINPGTAGTGALYVESWLHYLQVAIIHTDSILVKN